MTTQKFQNWRASAIREDGSESLLYLGSSVNEVRDGYVQAWNEHFDDEERGRVIEIELQKWEGTAEKGSWQEQSALAIPKQQQEKVA